MIVIYGAGAWGIALALSYHRAGYPVHLLSFSAVEAGDLQRNRKSSRLSDISIDPDLPISSDFSVLSQAKVLFWVTPAQAFKTALPELKPYLNPQTPILVCSKGIDCSDLSNIGGGSFLTSIGRSLVPNPFAVLSGPNFSHEVAQKLPAAATLASQDEGLAFKLAKDLTHSKFGLYASTDEIGVQLSGALKNVYAIAAGIVRGLELGHNAHCALITLGLSEISAIGLKMGAHLETFQSLAAVGDLFLTCSYLLSRNMTFGMDLSKAPSVKDFIEHEKNKTIEGLFTAKAAYHLASSLGLKCPILEAVHGILYENQPLGNVMSAFEDQSSI